MKYFRRKSTHADKGSGLEVAPRTDPEYSQPHHPESNSSAIPEVVQPGLEAHINRDVSLEVPIDTSPQPDQPGLERVLPQSQHAPSLWEKRFTSDLRPYYINHATEQTSWALPPGDLDESQVDLPPGWGIQIMPNHGRFFVNYNRKETTRFDPRWPPHMVAAKKARGQGPGEYVDGYLKRTNEDGTVEFVDDEGRVFAPVGDPRTGKPVGKNGMRILKLEDRNTLPTFRYA